MGDDFTASERNQMTVFLTTHYIEEAANSDYVVVMKEGRYYRERHSGAIKKYVFITQANTHFK